MIQNILSNVDLAGDIFSKLKEPAYNYVSDKLEEAELRKIIKEYNNRFQQHLESQRPIEEIDFEGLTTYVNTELFEDIMKCLNAETPSIRKSAKEQVLEKAYTHSGATNTNQMTVVSGYLDIVLDLIKAFAGEKIDKNTAILLHSFQDDNLEFQEKSEQRFQKLESRPYPSTPPQNVLISSNPVKKDRYFVHRENELKLIDEVMEEDNLFVLCGMGGIGKTSLAKKYALTQSKNIILVNCTNSILSGIAAQCIFRKNCASVPEERSAIPLETEQCSVS